MKSDLLGRCLIPFLCILFLTPLCTKAQCEIFKSEMEDLKTYINEVSHLTDSLQTYAESAAFGAQFNKAHNNARKVKKLMGDALTSAEEAVTMASSAQYHSEICGITAVKTHTVDVEDYITNARDFAEEAYINAKYAVASRNLGDIRYYMRKSQNASQEARNSADAALFSVSFAHMSCTHVSGQAVSIEE